MEELTEIFIDIEKILNHKDFNNKEFINGATI